MLYDSIRPFLFHLDPEVAHHLSLQAMHLAGQSPVLGGLLELLFAQPAEPVSCMGLRFPNRVGLAAGYDKDGLGWKGLARLGFGHVEVGTVTPRAQAGNPKPRVFRLTEDNAVINRMGFPGEGMEVVASRLDKSRPNGVVLGVNIGKNKDTPLESALEDYIATFDRFAHLADYIAVNVSSPNTPGLRKLQQREALEGLLKPLQQRRDGLGRHLPLLVKLAPDLDDTELDAALEAVDGARFDGIIATNTTIDRPSTLAGSARTEKGGLSGAPLREKSARMIREICQRTGGSLPVIAVGGIMSAADARARLDAGACLVQVYTGMIYEGPSLPGRIARALS